MNSFFVLLALAQVVLLAQETLQFRTTARRSVSQLNQCGTKKRQATYLIINGFNANVGEWPWHGALFHKNKHNLKEYKCGATLIHPNFVITACHCVVNQKRGVIVDFGRIQLDSSSHEQSLEALNIFVHPKYSKNGNKHDLAVLSLKTAVIVNDYVRPICLEPPRSETYIHDIVGKKGVVVGWGLTEDDEISTQLKSAEIPVVDHAECLETDPDLFCSLIYPGMFCAGSIRDGNNVCNGDSGGGMYFRENQTWILRGVVAFSGKREDGSNKCDVKSYAGFMNVRYYASWIHQILHGEENASSEYTTLPPVFHRKKG